MRKRDAQRLLKRLIAGLDDTYELVYLSQGDGLTEDQVAKVLTGEDLDVVDTYFDDWYSEARYAGAKYEIEQMTTQEERDGLEQHGLWDDLRFEIEDRDTSNIVKDLAHNTNSVLLRYDLDYQVEYNYTSDPEEREKEARSVARAIGVPFEEHQANLYELIDNASYGGHLYVIWYDGVGELYDNIWATEPQQITWDEPYIVCLDSMNGSGHDVKIKAEVTKVFDPSKIRPDSAWWGYSWDTVCGLYKPAFSTNVTIGPVTP